MWSAVLLILAAAGVSAACTCASDVCDCCDHTDSSKDPYCPNCHGLDYECLASSSSPQIALGAVSNKPADKPAAMSFSQFSGRGSGYCRMQQAHTQNRSTTLGPKLIADGRVFAGVGLSRAQFFEGPLNETGGIACGMCLEVRARMPRWDCELETVQKLPANETSWPLQTLVVMVVDVCEDNWNDWDANRTTGRCTTPPSTHATFLTPRASPTRRALAPSAGASRATSTCTPSRSRFPPSRTWRSRTRRGAPSTAPSRSSPSASSSPSAVKSPTATSS